MIGRGRAARHVPLSFLLSLTSDAVEWAMALV